MFTLSFVANANLDDEPVTLTVLPFVSKKGWLYLDLEF